MKILTNFKNIFKNLRKCYEILNDLARKPIWWSLIAIEAFFHLKIYKKKFWDLRNWDPHN